MFGEIYVCVCVFWGDLLMCACGMFIREIKMWETSRETSTQWNVTDEFSSPGNLHFTIPQGYDQEM